MTEHPDIKVLTTAATEPEAGIIVAMLRDDGIVKVLQGLTTFDEVLRVLDSCQLTAGEKVATPVNWNHGDDVIILPSVSDEEAKQKYPDGWKSPLPYIRVVPQPK